MSSVRPEKPIQTVKLLDDIEVLEEIVLIRDCYQSMYIKGELLLYFVDDRGRTAAVNTKIWKHANNSGGRIIIACRAGTRAATDTKSDYL